LSRALAELLDEGHRVALIHGILPAVRVDRGRTWETNGAKTNGHSSNDADPTQLMFLGWKANKELVSCLGLRGIAAFGVWGAEGNIIRTRISPSAKTRFDAEMEVAAINPFWIDMISRQQAVLVLANSAVAPDGRCCWLDADQMAADCAIAWRADALVLLSTYEGLRDTNGSAMRWLEASRIESLRHDPALSSEASSNLNACQCALQGGIHRVRILPFSHLSSLSQFYFARIDHGTEII
jgi:acetylglutamate kinase